MLMSAVHAAPVPLAKPNIIIILTDDMGFSDVGCFGSEIETPNLDRLAERGVRFTQFYNTARCCPTRASLLTGLYAHQAGMGGMTGDAGPANPGYRGRLTERCVTIAEVLGPAGYRTIQTGKWHVGEQRPGWPLQRGFDRFYGCPGGGGFYFRPSAFIRPRRVVRGNDVLYSPEVDPPEGWYATDAYTDEGLAYVREAVEAGKPFFWYLAYNAPHYPLKAKPEDIAKYRGRYKVGWDTVRRQRHQRLVELGIIDPNWPLSPRPRKVPAWDTLNDAQRDEQDLRMATYAAMIDCVDQNVGKVVRELRRLGVCENTLIVFLHDNGGCEAGGPLGANKGKGVCGTVDSEAYYGECWANVSDAPFRLYKKWIHEGGISTPLIAHWPKGIDAGLNGTLVTEPAHLIDLMATCVDLADAEYPETHRGHAILPMEGRSLGPAFRGEELATDRPLFFEHMGNKGIRRGKWKLVSLRGGTWELYDMEADRTELNDLSARFPERVTALKREYADWAKRCFVTKAATPRAHVETPAVVNGIVVRAAGELLRLHGTPKQHVLKELPDELQGLPSVTVPRGSYKQPAPGFRFRISAPGAVYLAVHNRGECVLSAGWQKTALQLSWSGKESDAVYTKRFGAGIVQIPGHSGRRGAMYGVPHVAFVKGADVSSSSEDPQ